MYSSKIAGGFTGTMGGYYERCFTTGKLEGYSEIGGFAGRTELPANGTTLSEIKFTDCYSTMLVGMRSASSNMGGFLANGYAPDKPHILTNCYAAGEVGDYSTDSTARNNKNNKNAGGFAYATNNKFEAKNCYYDKQTTAMSESECKHRKRRKPAGRYRGSYPNDRKSRNRADRSAERCFIKRL